MASEAVKIIVGAENKASAVFKQVANDAALIEGKFQDVAGEAGEAGEKVKGMLAKLVGPELAKFGSELSGISSQLRELKEKSDKGAKGLGTLKIAIVAALAAGATKISMWVLGLHKANKKIEQAIKLSRQLNDEHQDFLNRQQSMGSFTLGLIDDPDEKRNQLARYVEEAELELKGVQKQVKGVQKAFNEANNSYSSWAQSLTGGVFGEFGSGVEAAKNQVEETNERLEQRRRIYKDLAQQLRQLDMQQEADRIRAAQARTSIVQQRKEEMKITLSNMREELKLIGLTNEQLREEKFFTDFTVTDRKDQREFRSLLAQITAKKEEVRLEKERQEAIEKTRDANRSYLSGLELQLIALRDGADAAERIELAQRGVSKTAIERGSLIKAEINRLKAIKEAEDAAERRKGRAPTGGSNVAVESRTLTRGTGRDPIKLTADQTVLIHEQLRSNAELVKKQNRELEEQNKHLAKIARQRLKVINN